jgi:hypothetical protein
MKMLTTLDRCRSGLRDRGVGAAPILLENPSAGATLARMGAMAAAV